MLRKSILFILCIVFSISGKSQKVMTLDNVIRIATDSSLAAFKAKNLYLAGYWEYRTYISQKRPQVSLNSIPLDYNRALTKRYNSILDIDEYREQQNLYSYANLSISQNLPITGGTFYFDSELGYLQNFSKGGVTQYSSIPLRIGLNQQLFGFNKYKWQRKTEPLKYDKAKKELIQSMETISMQCVDYFFNLVVAKASMQMAKVNKANADTLYGIGLKRFEIASLSQADLLTLKVDVLNAENSLAKAEKELKKAQFEFNSYLRLPVDKNPELLVPLDLPQLTVDAEYALQLAETNNPSILENQQLLLNAEMSVDKTKRDNMFNANLNMSLGFNQQDSLLRNAYRNPLDQQRVMFSLSIPILDWGQNKGKLNMAKRNLEAINATVEQALVDFKQNVYLSVMDLNMQYNIVKTALETRDVAKQAYETTKQRFIIGKADVNSLNLILKRQDEANINYLNALSEYWRYYYNLRKITLHDFEKDKNLIIVVDNDFGLTY